MSTTEQAAILSELVAVRRRIQRASMALTAMTQSRDELITVGRAAGLTSPELASASGVSDSRIRQLAPQAATSTFGEQIEAWVGVPPERAPSLPVGAPFAPFAPTLPVGAPLLSEHVSKATRQPWGVKVNAWVELSALRGITDAGVLFRLSDDSARALLDALPVGVSRVFLCGAAPQGQGTSNAERVRSWGLEQVGEPWAIAPAGHYTQDATTPMFRWVGPNGTVEVLLASSWFGEVCAMDARASWKLLGAKVAAAFPGGTLLSTPATTGRDLWKRTIPSGKGFPVMSSELRQLIASTSGQGRMELLPPVGGVDACDEFTYLDGRLMYAALTWGLPVGEPTRWTRDQLKAIPRERLGIQLAERGRWLVRAVVPEGWDHVGLLPTHNEVGGWCYPSTPGTVLLTWADACEVTLAWRQGWQVELLEGFTWAEGKPLNVWTTKLVGIYTELRDTTQPDLIELAGQGYTKVGPIAARGVRAMILYAIGAFAARQHMVTKSIPLSDEAQLPANARARVVGDSLVWEEPSHASAWTEAMAHPEWSATIWARARVRLLDAPGADGTRVGALHVPRETVIAFRTDALYLSEDPGWADDGKPGRFRVKGKIESIVGWPLSNAQLFALRDRAEGNV